MVGQSGSASLRENTFARSGELVHSHFTSHPISRRSLYAPALPAACLYIRQRSVLFDAEHLVSTRPPPSAPASRTTTSMAHRILTLPVSSQIRTAPLPTQMCYSPSLEPPNQYTQTPIPTIVLYPLFRLELAHRVALAPNRADIKAINQ